MTEGRRAQASVLVLLIAWVIAVQFVGLPATAVIAVLLAVLTWLLTAPRSRKE